MGDLFIWILICAIFYMIINSMKPKEKSFSDKSEEKDSVQQNSDTEYTTDFKDKIATEMIMGKSSGDIVAEHPTLTENDVNQWKEDFLNNISRLSLANAELSMRVGELDMKVQWLEKACKKYIGDDWKDQTGYKYL